MAADEPRPHRPALFADLTQRIDAAGGVSPERRAEMAESTAVALVAAGRDGADVTIFVELADRIGLDTLAELWHDADPATLAGALWALYVLRQWTRTSPDEVVRLWRRGEPTAGADAVVAGVGLYVDGAAVQTAADAVLAGIYRGDVAVAFERAAAFLRVLAVGRRSSPESVGDPVVLHRPAVEPDELADRNERAARGLAAAADAWRRGRLS